MTKVYAVVSGKGGVGKTTLTVNLAMALQQLGKNVVIVDGNLTTPNISLHLGMHKARNTLHDVLSGKVKLDDAVYMHTNTGLRVIPAGISVNHLKTKFKKKLSNVVLNLVGATDIVLIDSAAGLGKDVQEIMEAADELIIVTSPDMPSLTDALRTITVAKEIGVTPVGVILNRVTGKGHEIKPKNVQEFLEVPIIGVIPEDSSVKHAVSLNYPVVYSHPYSIASKQIKKIASRLLNKPYFEKEKGVIQKVLDFFGF